jgi:excisionase family DNA binding protein
MATERMQRTTLTAKEAAEYLEISYWLITQLVKRKQIPCSRVGKRTLFRKEALDIYLSKKENDSIEESC